MTEIQTIGVVGAGAMGRGIAQIAAQAGLRVRLYDTSADAVAAARESLRQTWDKLAQKGKLTAADAQAALAEGRHQADRDGGLAHARLHTPDHDDLAASHLAFNSSLRVRLLSVRHLGLDRYFGAVRASARWSVVLNGDPSVALV